MPEVIPFIGPVEEVFWARPVSTGALIAILAGIILLSIYLYRRPWGMPLVVRVSLTISRVLVLALVVASLLEPTAVVKESLVQARSLPVLLDVSESMSIKDQRKRPEDIVSAATALGMFSTEENAAAHRMVMQRNTKQRQTITSSSRLDLGKAALTDSGRSAFDSLGESLEISFHAFGSSTRMISNGKTLIAENVAALEAGDPATSISSSLEAVASSGGIPPAGIVLFSDGIDNASSVKPPSS